MAGELTSADLDVERCCKEFAAKLQLLAARAQRLGGSDDAVEQELISLKGLAETMSKADLQAKLDELVQQMDAAEGATHSSTGKWVQVVHTGSDTLSMYSPEFYQKCFPELFPYGDGVYGLPRDTPLTFREWASYLLARVELEYEISDVATSDSLPETPFQPPIIPR